MYQVGNAHSKQSAKKDRLVFANECFYFNFFSIRGCKIKLTTRFPKGIFLDIILIILVAEEED